MTFFLIIQDGENSFFIRSIKRSMHSKALKKLVGWNRHNIYLSVQRSSLQVYQNIQP